MKTGAVIVAGGKGERAGGEAPKQLQMFGGRRLFDWSVEAFRRHPDIDQIVLVVPQGLSHAFYEHAPADIVLVEGGETRAASVLKGVQALQLDGSDIVMVHDAARPGLTSQIISELGDALNSADAAAPALKLVDAVKQWDGETLSTVDRSTLYRVQTPQAFRFGALRQRLSIGAADLVDDLQAIEAAGGRVQLIEGSEQLGKITLPGDFEHMTRLLTPPAAVARVGTGYDVHAFEPGDHVMLCGVKIPHTQTLAGHSDADVAWHALTDAILGAAALGDIGDHFPPSDPQWKGVGSATFLAHAIQITGESGYQISSCDITLICETPKVKPYREAMRQRTAQMTGLPLTSISVKATTTEGLGFTGRGEGIAAQAIAVLSATDT